MQVIAHFGLQAGVNGREAVMRCPFHDERTASLGINLRTGLWHCFGCGLGGNLEQFAMRLGNLNRLQAMILLRELRGRPGAATADLDPEWLLDDERPEVDPETAWGRFHRVNWRTIALTVPAARYLIQERGFRRGTLEAFDARFAERAGYPVVLPIRRGSELLGYVYRRIDKGEPDEKGREPKKYLFNTGFDLERSLAHYRVGDGPLVITEGVLDLMMCAQHGAPHAASILTWRMKRPQATWILDQGIGEVICATDNTPTGHEGYRRMRKLLAGIRVRRFRFPGLHRKDIGELNVNEFAKGCLDAEEEEER